MASACLPPTDQKHHDGSPVRGDEHSFHDNTDHNLSLLEENARLRRLVVRLSTIILKQIAEQK